METVTLRAEDFKTVHNTLCELRSIVGDMERSMIKIERLESIISSFERGLADAYAQDHAKFDSKMDHYFEVQRAQGFRTVWSIYEVEDLTAPHPFLGALQVTYGDHWGDETVVEEIRGNCWVDLYAAADAAIRRSGDDHHCFIEAFKPVADLPHQLRLTTGS